MAGFRPSAGSGMWGSVRAGRGRHFWRDQLGNRQISGRTARVRQFPGNWGIREFAFWGVSCQLFFRESRQKTGSGTRRPGAAGAHFSAEIRTRMGRFRAGRRICDYPRGTAEVREFGFRDLAGDLGERAAVPGTRRLNADNWPKKCSEYSCDARRGGGGEML